MSQLKFGILTVSDRCFQGKAKDLSGSKLSEEVLNTFLNVQIVHDLVEDEKEAIVSVLRRWAIENCAVILTTGGTGFSPRDVTPEATRSVIEKEAPGMSYAMIARGLEVTEFAMLSRAVCGIYQNTLIINLPGSPKGAVENFGFIKKALPHALALIRSDTKLVEKVHGELTELTNNSVKSPSAGSKVKLDQVALRPRTSQYPMLEVSDACNLIFRECSPTLQKETAVPYEDSMNRVLAEDIYAPEPIPPFRASIKDGYAVLSTDTNAVRTIRQSAAAGDEPIQNALKPGEAIRISTGAALPPGADAIVQVEDTSVVDKTPDNSTELSIRINKFPKKGQDIREIGSDVAKDSLLLKKNMRISHAHIGIFASCGITEVKVFKKPLIGVLSTGNEVRSTHETLQPGQIRDSNKPCLVNFIKKYGFSVNDCGIARDTPDEVKSALDKAFRENDVVISTGGVSMGEFDVIKRVLVEDFSAIIHFGRVNMKPGKPTTFATLMYNGRLKLFFGLPGNPVSCNVTAILFVIPSLRYLERCRDYMFPVVSITVSCFPNSDPRPEYHRVALFTENGKLQAMSTGNQISSRLSSMVEANGLLVVPGNPGKPAGSFNASGSIFGFSHPSPNPNQINIGRFRNLELPLRSPDRGDVNPPLLNKALITPSLFGYSHMCLTPNEPISGKSPVELSPCSPLYSSPNFRRQRGEKKPIPDEQKDEKYYERRRRNNQAAKKSRDARKIREDQVALRATILEHENAILRAQVLTLREEASSLRQMLLQKKALELATRDPQICIT